MALMVLGAVRLRTWARPERASGEASPVQVCRATASRGVAGRGPYWPVTAWSGESWKARVVVGQVRFLTRARPERALGGVTPGKALRGKAPMGVEWHVLGGALDGRRWGSTPHRGAARKRSWRGEARRGRTRSGQDGRGKAWKVARMVAGWVRLPSRARPERANGRTWRVTAGHGGASARLGEVGQGMGSATGRHRGSSPRSARPRKRFRDRTGTEWIGMVRRGPRKARNTTVAPES